jgi:hypothetical protein
VQQNGEEKDAGRGDRTADRRDDTGRDPESTLEGFTGGSSHREADRSGKTGASGFDGGVVPVVLQPEDRRQQEAGERGQLPARFAEAKIRSRKRDR